MKDSELAYRRMNKLDFINILGHKYVTMFSLKV